MALAPWTVQNIPDRLSLPITVLQPASMTPEPTNNPCLAKLGVAHTFFLAVEVVDFLLDVLGQAGMSSHQAAEGADYVFDLSRILVLHHHDQALSRGLVLGMDFGRQDPEMLSTVIFIGKGRIGGNARPAWS